MAGALENRTVAITEHRYEKELGSLIARSGATSSRVRREQIRVASLHREAPRGGFGFMVFFTGVGARFIAEEAESMARRISSGTLGRRWGPWRILSSIISTG